MSKKLTAPILRNRIRIMGEMDYNAYNCDIRLDAKTRELMEEAFVLFRQLAPFSKNGAREIWISADRGPISDFGNYEELIQDGEVESREEFEAWWLSVFPEETVWYCVQAVEDRGYQEIFVNNRLVLEYNPNQKTGWEYDFSEFTSWIVEGVRASMDMLRAGTYNAMLEQIVPYRLRTGTILRQHLNEISPELWKEVTDTLSPEEIREFCECMDAQPGWRDNEIIGRRQTFTANEFYRCCALGYAANNYKWTELSPKEQYYKQADGRDEGLKNLDPDSPEAFREWILDYSHMGGHPWEVCRGGNSTHVALFVRLDKHGFYLEVAGNAITRFVEAIRFYLTLRHAGYPVYMHDSKELAERLRGTELIGIVPEGVMPFYCELWFPEHHIIDFMNLPNDPGPRDAVIEKATWEPVRELRFLEVTP